MQSARATLPNDTEQHTKKGKEKREYIQEEERRRNNTKVSEEEYVCCAAVVWAGGHARMYGERGRVHERFVIPAPPSWLAIARHIFLLLAYLHGFFVVFWECEL